MMHRKSMKWHWDVAGWPNFRYEPERISHLDRQFLLEAGGCIAYLKTIDDRDYKGFAVEMLSLEGAESSRTERVFSLLFSSTLGCMWLKRGCLKKNLVWRPFYAMCMNRLQNL